MSKPVSSPANKQQASKPAVPSRASKAIKAAGQTDAGVSRRVGASHIANARIMREWGHVTSRTLMSRMNRGNQRLELGNPATYCGKSAREQASQQANEQASQQANQQASKLPVPSRASKAIKPAGQTDAGVSRRVGAVHIANARIMREWGHVHRGHWGEGGLGATRGSNWLIF